MTHHLINVVGEQPSKEAVECVESCADELAYMLDDLLQNYGPDLEYVGFAIKNTVVDNTTVGIGERGVTREVCASFAQQVERGSLVAEELETAFAKKVRKNELRMVVAFYDGRRLISVTSCVVEFVSLVKGGSA